MATRSRIRAALDATTAPPFGALAGDSGRQSRFGCLESDVVDVPGLFGTTTPNATSGSLTSGMATVSASAP